MACIQDNDEKVRSSLLEFSYNLAINNMDEAFRAVKAIKSTAVWENMAHLCIKNKRLDVAGEAASALPPSAPETSRFMPERVYLPLKLKPHEGLLSHFGGIHTSPLNPPQAFLYHNACMIVSS